MQSIFVIFKKLLLILSLPVILQEYFSKKTGAEYQVGFLKKVLLIFKMWRNNRKIPTATDVLEHLTMATKILTTAKATQGCVVECGTYYGASAANLSLACALTGRKLEIFDSFAGLPTPKNSDRAHAIIDQKLVHTYVKGAWRGNLAEVRQNIKKYGNLEVCNFNVGYFDKTLPQFFQECILIFLDVDLVESLRTCLRYLWPNLKNEGYLFTHEAHHAEIASAFFDKAWWRKNLNTKPPGLIGAGSGLGLTPDNDYFRSSIGYTVKNPKISKFKKEAQG